jgi:hypothetical protein
MEKSNRGNDMGYRNDCIISGALFLMVAVAHLLRIIYAMPVQVDNIAIPLTASWIGLIVTAALAAWAVRLYRDPGVG